MEEDRKKLVERHVSVSGTKSSWTGLAGWLNEARRVGSCHRLSSTQHRRVELVYRSLKLRDIHACRDLDTLQDFEKEMRDGRYWDSYFTGFFRVLSREEIGVFITEARNQIKWVLADCPVRESGPALDPARLPDDRLDFLIQSHRNLDLVERMRDEKRRRQGIA